MPRFELGSVACAAAMRSQCVQEYRLKPWDVCAGVLMVQEAGGKVATMHGNDYTVFERSILATNGHLHKQVLQQTQPKTESLLSQGIDLSPWFKPDGYSVS